MTVVPAASALTVALEVTDATPGLLDDHVAVTSCLDPSAFTACAITVVVSPTVRLVSSFATDTLRDENDSLPILTDPLLPSYVPVMTVVPAASAVTTPSAMTEATPALLDDHVGVTCCFDPSEYWASAVTVVVWPTVRLVSSADTSMLNNDTVSLTSTLTDPLWPPTVAVIVAVPTAWAVTVPVALTLATDALLDPHAALTVTLVPSP